MGRVRQCVRAVVAFIAFVTSEWRFLPIVVLRCGTLFVLVRIWCVLAATLPLLHARPSLTLASPADHFRGSVLDHHVPHHAGMVRPRLDRQRAVLGACVARHLLVCVLHLGQHGRQASTPHGLIQLPWAAV